LYEYNYLMHWGIKGMRWGVRKYRNPDGTLTEAGKKRYAKEQARERYGGRKSVSEMTDEELRTYTNRLRLEKEYSEMMSKLHPSKKKQVLDFTKKLMGDAVSKLATSGIDAIVKKAFSEKKPPRDEELSSAERDLKLTKAKRDLYATNKQLSEWQEADEQKRKEEREKKKAEKEEKREQKRRESATRQWEKQEKGRAWVDGKRVKVSTK